MKVKSNVRIMKKFLLYFLPFILLPLNLFTQEVPDDEFKPSGKAFGKVFWNYNHNFSKEAEQRNAFDITRAYLGYTYQFSKNISTKITLDGAGSSNASDFTVFLKTAQLDWKVAEPVKLSLGLIGLKQFDTQEKFWGYRYLFKSLQDEYSLGSSADLGINAEIKVLQNLKANLFILNGEGYKNAQDNMGRMKAGGNLIYTPVKGLTIKGYYDIYGGKIEVNDSISSDTSSVHSLAFFAGYKTDKFRIGAEYDIQLNGKKYAQQAADHNSTGIAVYGTYIINKKFEVFAEWLRYKSNTLDGAEDTWNHEKDVNAIITGVQYAPVKGLKVAADYRIFLFDDPDINTGSYFFLNFEFAF